MRSQSQVRLQLHDQVRVGISADADLYGVILRPDRIGSRFFRPLLVKADHLAADGFLRLFAGLRRFSHRGIGPKEILPVLEYDLREVAPLDQIHTLYAGRIVGGELAAFPWGRNSA